MHTTYGKGDNPLSAIVEDSGRSIYEFLDRSVLSKEIEVLTKKGFKLVSTVRYDNTDYKGSIKSYYVKFIFQKLG